MKLVRIVSFFGLIIMLSSCTMQKRIYSSGYHIEWNKSQNVGVREFANKVSTKQTKQRKIGVLQQTENKNNSIGIIEKKRITKSQNKKNIFEVHKLNAAIINTKTDTVSAKVNTKNKVDLNNTDASKTFSGLAIAGFICSFVEILALMASLIPYEVFLLIIISWSIVLFLFLLTILFSILGLEQIKKDKLKGKGLAIAGLIVGLFSIAFLIFHISMI